ncbi:MAG: phage tail protein [Saprospiraceae bacterium]
MQTPTPSSGFYFSLQIPETGEALPSPAEAVFKEVSGISVNLETETTQGGGENRFSHRVPEQTTFENLVLKSGLMSRSSYLADWCNNVFSGDPSKPINPRTIRVSLLDADTDSGIPLMSWKLINAYPVEWEIGPLATRQNDLAVESISFAYSYFEQVMEIAAD